jgi:hypothetical protein
MLSFKPPAFVGATARRVARFGFWSFWQFVPGHPSLLRIGWLRRLATRRPIPKPAAIRLIAPYAAAPDALLTLGPAPDQAGRDPANRPGEPSLRIAVACSSIGNYFFVEIADCIRMGLIEAGQQAFAVTENDVLDRQYDLLFVVAPHEFFILGAGVALASRLDWRRVVSVNTEQLQTQWFIKGIDQLAKSRGILDINPQTAAVLRDFGLDAHFLPMGIADGFSAANEVATLPPSQVLEHLGAGVVDFAHSRERYADRPLDVVFIGALTRRREAFLARSAGTLARYRCFFYLPLAERPFLPGKTSYLDSTQCYGLSQRTKVLLNIHQDDNSYFEWHRIVFHGIMQGALVLTESSFRVPIFEPDRHYIEAPLDRMMDRLTWLLDTDEGRAKAADVRRCASERLRDQCRTARFLSAYLRRPAFEGIARDPV